MGLVHALALRQNGITDVVGFDIDEEVRANFTSRTTLEARPASELGAYIKSEEFELAVVATTTPSKAQIVEQLIRSRKPNTILVEKPFADSLMRSRDLIQLANSHGVKLAVNHQIMFTRIFREIANHRKNHDVGAFVSLMVSGANFGLANKAAHYFEAFRVLAGDPLEGLIARLDSSPIRSHRGAEFSDFSGFLQGWSENNQLLTVDFSRKSRIGICFVVSFEFGKFIVNEISGNLSSVDYLDSEFPEVLPYNSKQKHSELGIHSNDIIDSTSELISSLLHGGYYPGEDAIEHSIASTIATVESSRRGAIVRTSDLNEMPIIKESFPWS